MARPTLIKLSAMTMSKYADTDMVCQGGGGADRLHVIKRHVLTHMMKKYVELDQVPDGPPNNPQRHFSWRSFDCMVDPAFGAIPSRGTVPDHVGDEPGKTAIVKSEAAAAN